MPTTLLCVPITVEDPNVALADASQAHNTGANLVEYRLDALIQDAADEHARAQALKLAAESPLPCIMTCRPAYEGGQYQGDDPARVTLFEALCAADAPPKYIDVEYLLYARSPELRARIDTAIKASDTNLILSLHDFNARPRNLLSTVASMRAVAAASVLKIAFRARSLRDNIEIFDLLDEQDRPTIALAMGEFGLMSRVLAPRHRAFLTFASLRDTSATAPGQPTIREIVDTYRFKSITPATRLYGVIGWPTSHSIGPQVHNASFEAAGHDAVYLPLPVAPEWESFKATLLALLDAKSVNLAGASVTIPHKAHLMHLALEDTTRHWNIDPTAARIGAANTLVVAEGDPTVANTDVAGILEPVKARVPDIAGLTVAILGAGGAARAAAGGLASQGARVTLFARHPARARALADDLDHAPGTVDARSWDEIADSDHSLYINATPLGMTGGPDPKASPLDDQTIEGLDPQTIIFDTVYNPIDTPLLRSARARNLHVIDGLEMFVAQARAQAELWTGAPAQNALFTQVSREALASQPAV